MSLLPLAYRWASVRLKDEIFSTKELPRLHIEESLKAVFSALLFHFLNLTISDRALNLISDEHIFLKAQTLVVTPSLSILLTYHIRRNGELGCCPAHAGLVRLRAQERLPRPRSTRYSTKFSFFVSTFFFNHFLSTSSHFTDAPTIPRDSLVLS